MKIYNIKWKISYYHDYIWTKIMKLVSKVTKKIKNLYISKIIYKYEFIFFLLKVIILVGCISVNYENLLERNIIFSSQLILWCCIIRIVLKKILYKYGWDGKYPVKELKELNRVLKSKKNLNKIIFFLFKYGNVWNITIIIERYIMRIFGYIKVYMLKKKKIKYWIKLEKIVTYILKNIIIEYIRIIIYEIYIPLKRRLLLDELTSIIEWRLWLLVIIIVFKGIFFIIKCILIIKLIKLLKICVVYDFAKGRNFMYEEGDYINMKFRVNLVHVDPQVMLGPMLYQESYIFKNMYIESKFHYSKLFQIELEERKIFYGEKEYFYKYNDIYRGLPLRYVYIFNEYVNTISRMFLTIEYALYKKELKNLIKEVNIKKYLKEFEESIKVIQELIRLLNKTTQSQKLIMKAIVNSDCLEFEIDYSALDLTIKSNNDKITKKEEYLIVKKLIWLKKNSNKLWEKYNWSKTNEFKDLCKIEGWRFDYIYDEIDVSKEDEKIYKKIMNKYKFDIQMKLEVGSIN